MIMSSKYTRHILPIRRSKTLSISLEKVDGAPVSPKGIQKNSCKPRCELKNTIQFTLGLRKSRTNPGRHNDLTTIPNLSCTVKWHTPAALLTFPLATWNLMFVFYMISFGSGRLSYTSLLMMLLLAPESIRKLYVFSLIPVSANEEDGLVFILTKITSWQHAWILFTGVKPVSPLL